jgi:hypothetical protein
MKIFIANNADSLQWVLAQFLNTATVEAEYGDETIAGSIATLAHHGVNAGNPAPCLAPNEEVIGLEVIGLSHLDLDALGGVLALLGKKPDAESFWQLAAYVDVNGPHKLGVSSASDEDKRRLLAFWAWAQENRVSAPRDGSAQDITEQVSECAKALGNILAGDQEMLEAGDRFHEAGEKLNADSFVEFDGGVVTRVAAAFTNHLYTTPDGEIGKAVVSLNPKLGNVTVSLADPVEGVSCRDIVQGLWGEEAGGHDGIAGSPRGQRMNIADLVKAQAAMCAALD